MMPVRVGGTLGTARKIAPAGLDTADRARWLELRRAGIGGSDAAAILGMDDYQTRWQVWVDKVSDLPDDATPEKLEAFEFGHEMEAVIARVWARRARVPGRVVRCGMLAHRDHGWMRVNVDRLVTDCGAGDGPCILECKNRGAYQSAKWSRDGDSEDVPDGPVIQVQHALMVTGLSHGHLAAAIGGNQLRWYRIDADPVMHKTLFEEEQWFWHDHVLPRVPPPVDGAERTGKILARLWDADPDSIVTATPAQITAVERLRELTAYADEQAEAAQALAHEIQQEMGEAEILADPGTGKPVATWKRNGTFNEKRYRADTPRVPRRYQRTVRRVDTKALADGDPDTYRRYRARVFRLPALPKPKPAKES